VARGTHFLAQKRRKTCDLSDAVDSRRTPACGYVQQEEIHFCSEFFSDVFDCRKTPHLTGGIRPSLLVKDAAQFLRTLISFSSN
jgi:hypothetical protein